MPVLAVIGGQWGDEAKGKIVDLLADRAQVVVRCSGGANAGHTIINEHGKFALHLVPAGIFNPQATSVIGNGTVIDPEILLREIDMLRTRGINTDRLLISERAHVILPYHLLLDGLEEVARGEDAIGTTRKGIGPAFADKVARTGIRMGELCDSDRLAVRLRKTVAEKNRIIQGVYGDPPVIVEDVLETYTQYGEILAPLIHDTERFVRDAANRGEVVMLEGAQGTLLDPDFGSYPFVTSSSPTTLGALVGCGLSAKHLTHSLGVFKSYCSRVGAGPFPTELNDATGDQLRDKAQEYGTTTGRPRRCGWFDAVAARYSNDVNGFHSIALTRLDILAGFETLRICVAYALRGERLDYFPSSSEAQAEVLPIYEDLPGWGSDISDARSWDDLPANAQRYVRRIEELTGSPVSIISLGPAREQTIHLLPVL
jgi:adenylosuccinate synthase